MILKFGKFKGQELSSTPEWYQLWLSQQTWFNKPRVKEKSLTQQLQGWDGHSKKGEAIYDAIFEEEKAQGEEYDKMFHLTTNDPYSMYYGL